MLVRLCCTFLFLFFFRFCFSQNALFIYPSGAINIQAGGNLVIKGGTFLSNGASINNSGNIHVNNSAPSYWIDSSFASGSVTGIGKIYFDGTGKIDFFGNNTFYDALINGSSINIDSPYLFSVTHQLYLQNGVINTNKSSIKILSANEDAVTADPGNSNYSSSWINGKLNRKIGTNTFSYLFPVGDGNAPHIATLINNNISGVNDLTIYFGTKTGNNAGLNVYEGFTYAGVHDKGIWYVSPGGSIASGNFNLRLSIGGFAGLQDNQFGILSRPFLSAVANEWQIPQGSNLPSIGSAGRTVSSGYAQRNNITTLSNQQFGIGFTSAPLPVNLVNLSGQRINHIVRLDWATLTETGNSGFEVQRQNGTADFKAIGFVGSKALAGNSVSRIEYSFTDYTVDSKVNFYRLKQLNSNGTHTYSPIISISAEKESNALFPNPAKDIIYVRLASAGNYQLSISNSEGRVVKNQNIGSNANLRLSDLANGYYTIIITNYKNEQVLIQKILLLKD